MGSVVNIIGRVVAGIASGGTSEAIRAIAKPVGKAIGVDKRIVEGVASYGRSAVHMAPTVGGMAGSLAGAPTAVAGLIPQEPSRANPAPVVEKPGMTDEERERLARVAASQRKKQYENMGRSSTILTGGKLGGVGTGEAKTLLGY